MPEKRDPTLDARPLDDVIPIKRGVGRPKKLAPPPRPVMQLAPLEQDMLDYFIQEYTSLYPDLTPADHLLLFLAGLEYIKYLRIIQEELETGKVISMARQHPGTNMRALLDMLSVTRKTRKTKPDEDPTENFLLSLSQ